MKKNGGMENKEERERQRGRKVGKVIQNKVRDFS